MKFYGDAYLAWAAKLPAYGINISEKDASTYYMRFSENNYSACLPFILDYFLPKEKRKEIIYAANEAALPAILGCFDFVVGETSVDDCYISYNDLRLTNSVHDILARMVYDLSRQMITLNLKELKDFSERFMSELSYILSTPVTATVLAETVAKGYFLWNGTEEIRDIISKTLEPRLYRLNNLGERIKVKEIKYITEETIKSFSDVYNFSSFINTLKVNLTSDYLDMVICK